MPEQPTAQQGSGSGAVRITCSILLILLAVGIFLFGTCLGLLANSNHADPRNIFFFLGAGLVALVLIGLAIAWLVIGAKRARQPPLDHPDERNLRQ